MPLQQPFPNTAWQASLLPASFRGVPFAVSEERGSGGRRGRLHEYPFRDTPYAEDLGRRARRYSISAFVLGDDAGVQRDALIAACEQPGPGILIHPTLGVLNVQVDPETPIEWTLRQDEGRSIEIRLSFVEPGQVLYPTAAADTQAQTNAAADNVGAAADQDLAEKTGTSVAEVSGFEKLEVGPPIPSIPEQAAQVQNSENTVAPAGMSDADVDSASQAGAGPGTLNTLKAHDDLDGAPSAAQQSAAGGPTMIPASEGVGF